MMKSPTSSFFEPDKSLWSTKEAKEFFEAFQVYGTDWQKVAQRVRSKDATACEELYSSFKSFLSLPESLLNVTAFLAVVKDNSKLHDLPSEDYNEMQHSDKSQETVTDGEKDQMGPRRSSRTPRRQKPKAVDFNESPMWGSRKPRRQSLRGSPANGSRNVEQEDADDAIGADALMSLANAIPEEPQAQALDYREYEEPMGEDNQEYEPGYSDDEFASPPQRKIPSRPRSTPKNRSASKSKSLFLDAEDETLSKGKRKRAKTLFDDGSDYEETEDRSITKVSKDSSSKGRKPKSGKSGSPPKPAKRGRRRGQNLKESRQPDLQAEQEDLDTDRAENGPYRKSEIPKRKKRRKARPERPPPMMASASTIFARRNSLAFGAPPAAFLLGVPPPSALWSGFETEGQVTMDPPELKMRHCLDPRVRRWCQAEFFCSVIDRPWFMKNELKEYLDHVGIPKGTKLKRPELSIIRSSLGQPRRLSLNFLREERVKLEAWREHVRNTYKDLGPAAELPTDIPKQPQVGSRVTARHPFTRQLHDGDVLTVNYDSYRVQFLRRELGVEMVKDVDVMPVDPSECLPADILQAHPFVVLNGRQAGRPQSNLADKPPLIDLTSPVPPHIRPVPYAGAVPSVRPGTTNLQPMEVIRSIEDLKAALDTKEALLARLKKMNDEIDAGMHKDPTGQRSPDFQTKYSQVLQDLHRVNATLEVSAFGKPVLAPLTFQRPVMSSGVRANLPPLSMLPQAAPPAPGVQQMPMQISPPLASLAVPGGKEAWEDIWKDAQNLIGKAKQKQLAEQPHLPSTKDNSKPPQEGEMTKLQQEIQKEMAAGLNERNIGAATPLQNLANQISQKGKEGVQEPKPNLSPSLETQIAGCISLLNTFSYCSEKPQPSLVIQRHTEKALALLRPKSKRNLDAYYLIEGHALRLQAHLSKAKMPESSGL